MEKSLQLGQAVEYEGHHYRLENFLENGNACQIANSKDSLQVPIESILPVKIKKKGTADAKGTKKEKAEPKGRVLDLQ